MNMELYNLPLSPGCRMARLALGEKGADFTLRAEQPWRRRAAFLASSRVASDRVPGLSTAGSTPLYARDRRPCADRFTRSQMAGEGP